MFTQLATLFMAGLVGRMMVGGAAHVEEAAPATVIPFVKAAYQFSEKFFTDTVLTSTSAQQQPPHNITPGGFLRGIFIEVSGATGALGTAVVGSDFPFSLIASLTLEDINGAPIVGPLTGWELYALNKYGGFFSPNGDPATLYNFRATFAAPYFMLWIPCEIRSDGLGALANTDARAQYRVNYTVDSSSNFLSTGTVTTQITLTINGFVEYWAQPEATDLLGNPQDQEPPLIGTTQFAVHEGAYSWAGTGGQTFKHNRVGNQIRNFMYIARTGAAATGAEQPNPRADLLTDPIRIRLDNRYIRVEAPLLRKARNARSYGMSGGNQTPGAGVPIVDTGVYVYPFSDDIAYHPSAGDDGGWLPTTEASFLQLEMTPSASGNVTILTNDVAVKAA